MANEKWTEDQKSAIYLTPNKMLVSAAAGSGKTAVLTERILQRLSDPNENADITKFLVVTYTRLAAAELRSRIGKKLREQAVKESDGALAKRLMRQCNRLGSAYISTIHSYCAALIKRHFNEFDPPLPPVLKVCEEAQAEEIKEHIMDKLIEHAYSGSFAPIPNFEAFANNFVTGNDKKLAEKLLGLYQTVSGLPNGLRRWREAADVLISDAPFLDTPWGELLASDYCRELSYYMLGYRWILEVTQYEAKADKYRGIVQTELDALTAVYEAIRKKDVAAAVAALSDISFVRLDGPRTPDSADERKYFTKAFRTPLKDDFIKALKATPVFSSGAGANGEDSPELKILRSRSSQISHALVALLTEFDRQYRNEKLRLGILDFADLEQYTYKLLYNEDGTLSPLSHEVSASFDEIFVDEFQDVNPMQSKIFDAISCECRIFQVGDIKQSIYGFRGAAPDIFADCRRRYTPLDRNDPPPQTPDELTVFLSANFRSMYPVTAFVNRIFDPIFHTPADYISADYRIPYSDGDRLICRRADSYEDEECKILKKNAPSVKMTVIEAPVERKKKKPEEEAEATEAPALPKLSVTEAECTAVAEEVTKLIKSGVKGKDIAIVARSAKHVAMIEELLMRQGITASNDKSAPLADMPEVQLALSILSCVDNPHKDIALAGALRSPVFGFTFDELITLRRYRRGISLFSALKEYSEENDFEKGKRFIEFIERLRIGSAGKPVSQVLWQIYAETDFFSLIYDGGKASAVTAASRRANLIKLHSLASDGENVGRDGIYTFLKRFERISESNNAPTASGVKDDNTVKFYTTHGSKGLEFPHCFVCGLGHSPKKSQQSDTASDTVCDSELGIAVKLRDSTAITRTDTPVRKAIEAKMKYTQFEEELRILYVALTRAKDNLYVYAAIPENYADMLQKVKAAAALQNPIAYYKLSSPIEWIFTALYTERDGNVLLPAELLEINVLKEEELRSKALSTANKPKTDTNATVTVAPDEELYEKLKNRLGRSYSHKLSALLPAKLSVSRLHPTLLDEDKYSLDPFYEELIDVEQEYDAQIEEDENEELDPPKIDVTKDVNESELDPEGMEEEELKSEPEKAPEKTSKKNSPKKEEKKKPVPLKKPLFSLGARLTGIRDKIAAENADTDVKSATDAVLNALRYNMLPDDLTGIADKVSAAERGTAAHLFMQFCDLENTEKNGVQAEIDRLCREQFILPYHAALIDTGVIERFMTSRTYRELKKAKRVRREVRFNTRLPAREFTEDSEKAKALEEETLLVQGVIDCYYVTEDGKTVLLDYKTDSFPEEFSDRRIAAILRKRHSAQLYYYKQALERLLLHPVDRVEIFSFALGRTVKLKFKQ